MQSPTTLNKADFEALSEFRYQLKRFLRFSEDAAKSDGLTPLQYLVLLHVRGYPGKDNPTVGELAERLQTQHHGAVALVTRCEELGLVERVRSAGDRRRVEVHLLARGEQCLARLAVMHRQALSSLQSVFRVARITSFNDAEAPQAGGSGR